MVPGSFSRRPDKSHQTVTTQAKWLAPLLLIVISADKRPLFPLRPRTHITLFVSFDCFVVPFSHSFSLVKISADERSPFPFRSLTYISLSCLSSVSWFPHHLSRPSPLVKIRAEVFADLTSTTATQTERAPTTSRTSGSPSGPAAVVPRFGRGFREATAPAMRRS